MSSLLDQVGGTPLVELSRRIKDNTDARLFVKLEYLNPSGSIKDRIAKYIVEDAKKSGALKDGGTIVESTSGNTGASLAMIAKIAGHQVILTMPDKVSKEKKDTLKALGAEVIVAPTSAPPDSEEHYVNLARKIASKTKNAFLVNQYDNKKNPEAHYSGTAREIWEQTNGKITHFIASGSTGGTISGVSRYLKEKNPGVKTILLDPLGSVYFDYFHSGKIILENVAPYLVEGVGEDHIPKAIDFTYIDDVVRFSDKQAFDTCVLLAKKEGILGGGSSGANVWGALKLIKGLKERSNVVTMIPDSGTKYLSKIYNPKWIEENVS